LQFTQTKTQLKFQIFSFSLIEKQSKLYSCRTKFFNEAYNPDLTIFEPHKKPIKTELEEDDEDAIPEDVFIDCTTFIGSSNMKIEDTDLPFGTMTKRGRKKKEVEVNDEEHEKLLEEFKQVLKKRKEKT
jgi:hypothetical protein